MKAHYHLPGLFEFYELYSRFLPLYFNHREYFYEWCDISSIYGAPADCLFSGGRVGFGDDDPVQVFALLKKYNISPRLTFSNSLLKQEHLSDYKCNELCAQLQQYNGGVIIASNLLLNYLKEKYPNLYYVSSTTKVILDFDELIKEINNNDYRYVVPDFRFNKTFSKLETLNQNQKDKIEFLCNESCFVGCKDRKACYESVSHKALNEDCEEHICKAPHAKDGYVFSKAKLNPMFISVEDINNIYLPMGFSNFKIEGRSLGSALILEFLLYYLTKPEFELNVREAIYLDNTLDLF